MLEAESAWIGEKLRSLPAESFPLLNLGSSTAYFREVRNPWIENEILSPLRQSGRQVIHVDLKQSEGVDLVVDFLSAEGNARLAQLCPQAVLVSNLLEHLPVDPALAAERIVNLAPSNAYILATCPLVYGYHGDPIDNGFRPTPEQLARLFERTCVVESAVVECHRGAYYFSDSGRRWLRFMLRMCAPFIRPRNWWRLARYSWPRTSASCVLLLVLGPDASARSIGDPAC